jgi:hypothetical protein
MEQTLTFGGDYPDRAAMRRNRADAALGPDGLRPDPPSRQIAPQSPAGQRMRKLDGWETLDQPIEPITLDLVA